MELTKERFIRDFKDILHERQLIKVADATSVELFQALASTVRKYITPLWLERRNQLIEQQQKTAYYFSIEFLPGRMLETNLLNLGILDTVKEGFAELGVDFEDALGGCLHGLAGNHWLSRIWKWDSLSLWPL